MLKHSIFFSIVIVTLQVYPLIAIKNYTNLLLCMQSKTIEVNILSDDENNNLICQCQANQVNLGENVSEDYTHTPGIGSHKLHTLAKPWNTARRICNDESAHLAIINSRAEEEVLLNMLKAEAKHIRHGANKEQAFLGVHDLYQEGEWLTIFGESIYSTGYSRWSTSWWRIQPDNKDSNQNCAALVLKGGGMDDVHCHEKFAFFCELPLSCTK